MKVIYSSTNKDQVRQMHLQALRMGWPLIMGQEGLSSLWYLWEVKRG